MARICHVKIKLASEAAKNLPARAADGSPIDLVTAAGLLTVQKV